MMIYLHYRNIIFKNIFLVFIIMSAIIIINNEVFGQTNIAISNNQKDNAEILNKIFLRIVPNEQIEDQGDSKDTRGADSRGNCEERRENFIALSPNTLSYDFNSVDDKERYLQKTFSKTPSIYFYTSVKSPLKAQFFIMNMEGETLDTFPVQVPKRSSFFQVSLSPHFHLKTSIQYIWKLDLYREGDFAAGKPAFMSIIGSIQRTNPSDDLYYDITNSSLRFSHIYSYQGYWYEAINIFDTLSKSKQEYHLVKMLKNLNIYSCIFPRKLS